MKQNSLTVFFSKLLFLAFVVALAVSSPPAAAEKKKAGDSLVFNNPNGAVTFNHANHKKVAKCKECHPPFAMKYNDAECVSLKAHGTCIPCHTTKKVSTDCSKCHADPGFKTVTFDEKYLKAASPGRQKTLDFFFKRRSVRKYEKKEVPDDVIHDVLKAAMSAPTAGNWQSWIFVVVKDQKIKTALSETSPFAHYIKDAPVVIAIAGRRDNFWAPFDCGITGSYLLLAATDFGLGVTYCGLDEEREVLGRKILNMPETYTLFSYIPMGYPAEHEKPHTKYNSNVIYYDKFEAGRDYQVIDRASDIVEKLRKNRL